MTLDDFLPHVLVELPGCSIPLVKQALVMTAIEFCQKTLCWDEMQDPFALKDGRRDYDIDSPAGAVPYLVRDVWVGGRRLRPASMAELQLLLPNWRTSTGNEPAFYNSAADRSMVSLFPIPSAPFTSDVVMRVAFVPTAGATTLPDVLGIQYLQALCAGTKSRLMAMPGQQWSNPGLVGFYADQFSEAISVAKAEGAHERTAGTLTVAPRAFI